MTELIKDLLMPSNVAILSLLFGIVLLFFGRFTKLAKGLLMFACAVIIIFSSGMTASLLLAPLEYKYPFIKDPAAFSEMNKIVVLTGYAADDPLMPLSSKLNSSSAFRVLEAHRLYQSCPDCEIIISGNKPATTLMKELLVNFGVPSESISLDSVSGHTHTSARTLRTRINTQAFYLVTSAGHMPRSIGVFEKQGMKPVAAPTDYLLPKDFFNASLGLSPQHLYYSNLAVREHAGIAWYKLTGKM